jgi:hypothetical protein
MVENILHVRLSFFVFDAALLESNKVHAKFNRTNILIPRHNGKILGTNLSLVNHMHELHELHNGIGIGACCNTGVIQTVTIDT